MSGLMVVAIALGGAVGALLRALVGRWINSPFPLATLLVNIAGSFLYGFSHANLPDHADTLRALLEAGFCGAFTTFSTFILDAIILLRSDQRRRASTYLFSTVFLCCLASWLGLHFII